MEKGKRLNRILQPVQSRSGAKAPREPGAKSDVIVSHIGFKIQCCGFASIVDDDDNNSITLMINKQREISNHLVLSCCFRFRCANLVNQPLY